MAVSACGRRVSGWIKYTQTGNLYALGDQMQRGAVLSAADADQELYSCSISRSDDAPGATLLDRACMSSCWRKATAMRMCARSEGGAGRV